MDEDALTWCDRLSRVYAVVGEIIKVDGTAIRDCYGSTEFPNARTGAVRRWYDILPCERVYDHTAGFVFWTNSSMTYSVGRSILIWPSPPASNPRLA